MCVDFFALLQFQVFVTQNHVNHRHQSDLTGQLLTVTSQLSSYHTWILTDCHSSLLIRNGVFIRHRTHFLEVNALYITFRLSLVLLEIKPPTWVMVSSNPLFLEGKVCPTVHIMYIIMLFSCHQRVLCCDFWKKKKQWENSKQLYQAMLYFL